MDAGNLMGGIAAAVDNILDTVSLGYNIFTNERDFDYQKALQQQMFEREDTAVQRRMEDLKAAGLNPNLAAGSAAGAGSVVARSNTNDLNPGSALDTLAALQQIKNSSVERDILKAKAAQEERKNTIEEMQALHALGYSVSPVIENRNGKDVLTYSVDWNKDLSDNRLFQNIDYQTSYNQNSAALLQKENEWYVTNQVQDIVFDAIDAGIDILKPSFMKNNRR